MPMKREHVLLFPWKEDGLLELYWLPLLPWRFFKLSIMAEEDGSCWSSSGRRKKMAESEM